MNCLSFFKLFQSFHFKDNQSKNNIIRIYPSKLSSTSKLSTSTPTTSKILIISKQFQNKMYFENEKCIREKIQQNKLSEITSNVISIDSKEMKIIYNYVSMDAQMFFESHPKISLYKKKKLLLDILHKLVLLHTIGIEHNDLKLENILIDPSLKTYLIDFEMSTMNFKNNKLHQGTLIYMPPESFFIEWSFFSDFGKKDIWSFGILCCIILYGRTPILENTMKEYIQLSTRIDIPLIIQSCFKLNPKHRISSYELYHQFESFLLKS